MLTLPQPQHMPCPECGASVPSDGAKEHFCDWERRVDYQLFQLRSELARFEPQLEAYLGSPEGRFEVWYAERARSRRDLA